MKSRFEEDFCYCSNNYLRLHGYAMPRRKGKRKRATIREQLDLPFTDAHILRKAGRVKNQVR